MNRNIKFIPHKKHVIFEYGQLDKGWGVTLGKLVQEAALLAISSGEIRTIVVSVDDDVDFDVSSVPIDVRLSLLIVKIKSLFSHYSGKSITLNLTKGSPQQVTAKDFGAEGNDIMFNYDGSASLKITIYFDDTSGQQKGAGIFHFPLATGSKVKTVSCHHSYERLGEDMESDKITLRIVPSVNALLGLTFLRDVLKKISSALQPHQYYIEKANTTVVTLDQLGLSERIRDIMSVEGIEDLGQLLKLSEDDLFLLPSLSGDDVKKIMSLLKDHGMKLRS